MDNFGAPFKNIREWIWLPAVTMTTKICVLFLVERNISIFHRDNNKWGQRNANYNPTTSIAWTYRPYCNHLLGLTNKQSLPSHTHTCRCLALQRKAAGIWWPGLHFLKLLPPLSQSVPPVGTAELLTIFHLPKTMAWCMVVTEGVLGTVTSSMSSNHPVLLGMQFSIPEVPLRIYQNGYARLRCK